MLGTITHVNCSGHKSYERHVADTALWEIVVVGTISARRACEHYVVAGGEVGIVYRWHTLWTTVMLNRHTTSKHSNIVFTYFPGFVQTLQHCFPQISSIKRHLRSAERRDMLVPRTRTELGRRSFSVAAPTVWNSLPTHLRSTLIGRREFGDGLKSHLFADAYFWCSENIRYKSVMYLLTYLLTKFHQGIFNTSQVQHRKQCLITQSK